MSSDAPPSAAAPSQAAEPSRASPSAGSARRLLLAPAVSLGAVAVAMLLSGSAILPPALSIALMRWTLLLALGVAAAGMTLLLLDPRVDVQLRRAWALIAVATTGLAIPALATAGVLGDLSPGLLTTVNLVSHPIAFGAVMLLPCGLRTTLDRVRLLFDVFVTAGAATTLTLAVAPAGFDAHGIGIAPWVHAALIIADALLFAAAVMLWLRGAVSRWRDPLAPLALAFVIHFVLAEVLSVVVFGTTAAMIVACASALPFGLTALAATRHHASLVEIGVTCGRTRRLSALPTLAATTVLVTLLLLTLTGGRTPDTVSVAGAALVGLAALARQVLGLRGELHAREQSATEQADRRLAALVRHGSDMVTILDPDTTVRYASPSHWSIVGIPPDALVGRRMAEEIHRDDFPAAEKGFARLLSGASQREAMVVRLRDGTGKWRWLEAVGTNLIGEPSIGGLVLNSRDITDRKQLEAKLLEQALLDPLTQLGNRRMFSDRVSQALARRARHSMDVAVMLLDLDHFKFVNDTMGHAKGDALLVAVADRVRNLLRDTDTVCRLGGDEFAVLLEDLHSPDDADATAARIQQVLDRPFALDSREVFVRVSIGIAWAADGQDVDDLLTDADVAMYSAKSAGRGRIERYSSEMRARVADRVTVEADLRHAIDREEFELFYQPVVDLETGVMTGAEALIRWRHPLHGLMLPGRFIQVAEESDLIVAIGRFVLRRAARDAAFFRGICPASESLRVAVNVSARQLRGDQLVDDVLDAMEDAGIPGTALTLEITETVLASNEALVADRLQALREWGICVALDDFGTGYSSLAYLRRFPIDIIKVDKSFVSFGGLDAANDGVTRAIVSIGQSLGMQTVAEGIETLDQLAKLRGLGCTLGQGYLFAKPLPRDAFAQLLAGWNADDFRPVSTAAH